MHGVFATVFNEMVSSIKGVLNFPFIFGMSNNEQVQVDAIIK